MMLKALEHMVFKYGLTPFTCTRFKSPGNPCDQRIYLISSLPCSVPLRKHSINLFKFLSEHFRLKISSHLRLIPKLVLRHLRVTVRIPDPNLCV